MTLDSPPRMRATPRDPLAAALAEFAAAQEAWRAALRASEAAPSGSRSACVTIEAARQDLQMARGRLALEESWRYAHPDKAREKSWGSH